MASDFRTWENEVNRINKQIQRTARTFGYNSPEYQRYESMILSPKSFDQSGIMFKAEQGKPIRLLRTKSAYEASQVIPQYAKAIEKLGREKKVGEVKKNIYPTTSNSTVLSLVESKESKCSKRWSRR